MISELHPDAGADKEEESFEKLFEKLNVMKGKLFVFQTTADKKKFNTCMMCQLSYIHA